LKYLLDTNIVIYTMKNRPQQVKRRFHEHHGRMGISAVTLGELVFGAEHSLTGVNYFFLRRQLKFPVYHYHQS
jgi:predicted nucleic acid-binding protein